MIGEPLVEDQWVARVEDRLRKKYPQIPETAEFATYVQPATWHRIDGIDVPLPDVAVFILRVPDPKHPGMDLVQRGAETMANWRNRVRAYEQLVGTPDPLYVHFEAVVRALSSTHKNLREMVS